MTSSLRAGVSAAVASRLPCWAAGWPRPAWRRSQSCFCPAVACLRTRCRRHIPFRQSRARRRAIPHRSIPLRPILRRLRVIARHRSGPRRYRRRPRRLQPYRRRPVRRRRHQCRPELSRGHRHRLGSSLRCPRLSRGPRLRQGRGRPRRRRPCPARRSHLAECRIRLRTSRRKRHNARSSAGRRTTCRVGSRHHRRSSPTTWRNACR